LIAIVNYLHELKFPSGLPNVRTGSEQLMSKTPSTHALVRPTRIATQPLAHPRH
jgi:hypothetical protein